ncbi:MAG TPA: antibiotic biosynthesis monooxygenase [Pyrinomonadaceae bacterium]|nr:antibiotic biosynthesis monooxygenase [Pyrinomonadaceae bacterium]
MSIAKTPEPPYYAVIFTSFLTENTDGYAEMGDAMEELAREQKGYLGIEAARDRIGITVSYWQDLDSIKAWRENVKHLAAQRKGYEKWYKSFATRICKVERDNFFERSEIE